MGESATLWWGDRPGVDRGAFGGCWLGRSFAWRKGVRGSLSLLGTGYRIHRLHFSCSCVSDEDGSWVVIVAPARASIKCLSPDTLGDRRSNPRLD